MAVNTFTGATNNNWGTATNWSQGTVPTATDGHTTTFDNTSPNCTVDTSARVCQILTFNGGTGYTNTITMTNTITVSGSITLGAAMVIAGTSNLEAIATGTLTSNGKTWSNGLRLAGTSQTYTLADNWTVTGTLTTNGTTLTTINGAFNLNIGGSWIPTVPVAGTATVIMNGTGTLGGSVAANIRTNLTINTAGTITFSATFSYNTGTFTYTAGTVVTTGSLFTTDTSNNTTTQLNVAGITFNNVTLCQSTGTITLLADINLTGNLILGRAGTATTINGLFNINVGGNVSNATTSGTFGTSTVVMNGTGTWSTIGFWHNHLTINTTGTVTIDNISFSTTAAGTCTITYIAGNVTVTPNTTLSLGGSSILNTEGIIWENVNLAGNDISGTKTITLNSLLTVKGYIRLGGAATAANTQAFAGTHGFVCDDLIIMASNFRTINLVGGVSYFVKNLFISSNVVSAVQITASGTGRAKLIVSPNALVAIYNTRVTNIDNGSGYPLYMFGGFTIITTSGNWFLATKNIQKPTNISQGLNIGSANGLY